MASLTTCTSSGEATAIQQFYEGQSILITGGTGFLGKLLIEKLLRSCSSLSCIYLLIRPKNDKNINERIDEIVNDQLFIKLKEERPNFRDQIVAISGDCSLPELGISQSDYAVLCQRISLVFHLAASVRFHEKMKLAVAINIRGTRDILRLCKNIKNLKACIHVSTAFANCIWDTVEERFYDSPCNSHSLISLVEGMDETLIDDMTTKLIGKWPNTYTFTKAVAEDMVRQESIGLLTGVFRPVIVIPTYLEPLRGWIDNMYGPTGVAIGTWLGVLRTLYCDVKKRAELIPGDITVNALIASAWDVSGRKKEYVGFAESENNEKKYDDLIPIYNHSSKANPITWGDFETKCLCYGINLPPMRAVWYDSFRITKSKLLNQCYALVLHLLPALIIDTFRICMGKKARLLRMYKKMHKFMKVIEYFTDKEWNFPNDNILRLIQIMDERDQELFPMDIKAVDWDAFCQDYIRGIRIYLMKDPIETLPQARAKQFRLFLVHQGLKLLCVFGFLGLSWRWIPKLFY